MKKTSRADGDVEGNGAGSTDPSADARVFSVTNRGPIPRGERAYTSVGDQSHKASGHVPCLGLASRSTARPSSGCEVDSMLQRWQRYARRMRSPSPEGESGAGGGGGEENTSDVIADADVSYADGGSTRRLASADRVDANADAKVDDTG
eukprot:361092-Pyramimonas_sp.AAC.1